MNKTARKKIKAISAEFARVKERFGDISDESVIAFLQENPESPLAKPFAWVKWGVVMN